MAAANGRGWEVIRVDGDDKDCGVAVKGEDDDVV